METSSENVQEELKRKVRIAAGGIQSIIRLSALFNAFKHPLLSFQYISHRVLRWTITPFLIILAFILNEIIAFNTKEILYEILFALQVLFYLLKCTVSGSALLCHKDVSIEYRQSHIYFSVPKFFKYFMKVC